MLRPDWSTLFEQTSSAYVNCSCGLTLQTIAQVRDHWQRGHFDTPDPPELTMLRARMAELERALSPIVAMLDKVDAQAIINLWPDSLMQANAHAALREEG